MTKPGFRRGILITLIALVGFAAASVIWAFCHELESYRLRPASSTANADQWRFTHSRDFQLRTVHGPIAAWYIEGSKPAAVIVGHGFGASMHELLPELTMLHRHGYAALALDWPGQGRSPGKITLGEPEQAAIEAAIRWLRETAGIAPGNIFGLGMSIGGYLMGQYASRHEDIHALVLAGTMPSLAEFTDAEYVRWGKLAQLGARLANVAQGVSLSNRELISEIRRFHAPLLVIAGARDAVVPALSSRRLFDAANAPKSMLVLEASGHCDYLSADPQRYEQAMMEFFDRALQASLSSRPP